MRLDASIRQTIVAVMTRFLQGAQGELRLFGSRTQDHLRGGDIDLLLILDRDDERSRVNQELHRILAAIKLALQEDERIDLIVTSKSRLASDPFLANILPGSLQVAQWHRDAEPSSSSPRGGRDETPAS